MKTIAFLAVLLSVACSSESDLQTGPITPNVAGDTARAELSVGQMLALDDVTIRFQSVDEDSRCPVDVTCVWQGNARIRLAAAGSAAGEATLTVNTTTDPREVEYGGWTISIGALSPEPHTQRKSEPYTLSLVLVRH